MSNQNMTRREALALGGVASTLLLAACGGTAEAPEEEPTTEPVAEEEQAPESPSDDAVETSASGKILVVFYSRADENYADGGVEVLEVGHTKVMAGYIAEALGADTYEIVPVEPYPEGYDDCCDQALAEQRDDVRPAIEGELPDVSGYDLVFVGCPIWWGSEPMVVRSFLDAVDLSGKTVVPFTTHGGSGLGNVPASLQSRIPGATLLDGKAVAGTAVDGAHDEVVDWAKSLDIA